MVTSGGFAILEMSTTRTSERGFSYACILEVMPTRSKDWAMLGGAGVPFSSSGAMGPAGVGGCRHCCNSRKTLAEKVCQNSMHILKVSSLGPPLMRTR